MTDYQDDKRKKADELDKKKCEADSGHSIGLDETHVDQRLCNAGSENADRKEIYGKAADASNGECQHNSSKHRKVLDAVRVSPHRAPIPILSLDSISPELADRHSSGKNSAPAIHPNR
jgi:hypothetical protein